MRTRARTARAAAAVILAASVGIAGCTFDPSSVPTPGMGVSGPTYPLHIQFANVLNLPPGAKVLVDGVVVGRLTGLGVSAPAVAAGRGYVTADIEIERSVALPATVTAELRQATPLGDIHIALTTDPVADGPDLGDDGTIPLAQTIQSPQVEDTLAGIAAGIGSGVIGDIQDTVRQANSVLPADPRETARIFGVLGSDLEDLAANQKSIDAVLDGLQANTQLLVDDGATIDTLLTPYGVQHTTDVIRSVVAVFFLLAYAPPVAHNAVWLTDLVGSADSAARAFMPVLFGSRPLDLTKPSNMNKVVDLIQNKIIPFVEKGPKVDVTSVRLSGPEAASVPTGEQTGRVIAALRMIGLVR